MTMMIRPPLPRLLPMTIGILAGLLAVKSVGLVRMAMSLAPPTPVSLISTTAQAASHASNDPATPGVAPGVAHGATPAPATPSAHGSASGHGASTDQGRASGSHPASPTSAGDTTDGPAAGADSNPAKPTEPPVSASERAILLELRQRRQELETRESALAARESVLTAAEQKLTARIAELQALQSRLEGLEAGQQQREDASWKGLVKLYESMKPRDAAAIFNELEMPVLLQVVSRMKDAKAGSILAAMNPDKARDVTTGLARLRSGPAALSAAGAAATAPNVASSPTGSIPTGTGRPPVPAAQPPRSPSPGG